MKRAAFIVILIILLVVSGYAGYRHFKDNVLPEREQDEAYDTAIELYKSIRPDIPDVGKNPGITEFEVNDGNNSGEKSSEIKGSSSESFFDDAGEAENLNEAQNENEESEYLYDEISSQAEIPQLPQEEAPLAACEEISDEVVAWLNIPGTTVDYPVVQADDNEKYLWLGIDGNPNGIGTPFLDYRCEGDLSGFNSIIYAHNMSKQRLFSQVMLFKEPSFMESHPYGVIITDKETAAVDFFAYLKVPSDSAIYHTVFLTDKEREDYIRLIFSLASYTKFYTPDDLDEKSRLVLLSTCTVANQDSRSILVGVVR